MLIGQLPEVKASIDDQENAAKEDMVKYLYSLELKYLK